MPQGLLKSPDDGGVYLNEVELHMLEKQHERFALEGGIELISKILTEKDSSNEEKIAYLTHPKFLDQTKIWPRKASERTLSENIEI